MADANASYTANLNLSWDEVTRDCRELAAMLKKQGEVKGLVGIARGGLVPTAIIAHAMDIRNIKTVAVTSYYGQRQVNAELLGSVEEIKDGDGWIFIDDMADTGQTAKLLKKRYPKAKLAVVYSKPEGVEFADFYVRLLKPENWIVYPWEVAEE